MFEDLIEKRTQELSTTIRRFSSPVKLSTILDNSEVATAYKCFYVAEVDWWIYEEQIRRKALTRFDLSGAETESCLYRLDELYRKNAVFSPESLKSVTRNAIEIRLNFLLRPRTTLKWFVYRREQTKPIYEIIRRLNYFDDYQYLITGLTDEIRQLQNAEPANNFLSFGHFSKAVNNIDNKYIDETTPETFIKLLDTLFAFFSPVADYRDTEKIPTEAVITFLDDKNLCGIAKRLEELFHRGELLSISKKYLLGIIYKSLYDKDVEYGGGNDKISDVTNELLLSNIAVAKETQM